MVELRERAPRSSRALYKAVARRRGTPCALPAGQAGISGKFARWAPTALSAASSARYSVKVYEIKLVVRTVVPSGLTDISPSSQKHRDALVDVAGVPRPRTKHKSSSGVASTGIRQVSISSIANCIGTGPLQRWVLLTLHGSSWQRRL